MQSGGSGPGVDSEEPDGVGTAYAKALRLESAHLRIRQLLPVVWPWLQHGLEVGVSKVNGKRCGWSCKSGPDCGRLSRSGRGFELDLASYGRILSNEMFSF